VIVYGPRPRQQRWTFKNAPPRAAGRGRDLDHGRASQPGSRSGRSARAWESPPCFPRLRALRSSALRHRRRRVPESTWAPTLSWRRSGRGRPRATAPRSRGHHPRLTGLPAGPAQQPPATPRSPSFFVSLLPAGHSRQHVRFRDVRVPRPRVLRAPPSFGSAPTRSRSPRPGDFLRHGVVRRVLDTVTGLVLIAFGPPARRRVASARCLAGTPSGLSGRLGCRDPPPCTGLVYALSSRWAPVLSLGVLYVLAVLFAAIAFGPGYAIAVRESSSMLRVQLLLPAAAPGPFFALADGPELGRRSPSTLAVAVIAGEASQPPGRAQRAL